MSALRLTASGLVTLVLLTVCALIASSTFSLPGMEARGSIGAGAIPQFVVVATVLLSLLVFIGDVFTWLRANITEDESEIATPKEVMLVGIPVFLILAGYVVAWRYVNFLVTSILFFALLSVMLGWRGITRRGLVVLFATSILFSTGIWALFVFVLKVPLR